MSKFLFTVFLLCSCLFSGAGIALGQEQKSRYVTLSYNDREVLQEFNDNLQLSRKLSYNTRKKNVVTVADEVLAKTDIIIEKVQIVLDMFPNNYILIGNLFSLFDSKALYHFSHYRG